ncbi:MAG: MATE family efflux transporter, partial [Solirubrobacteraceae bacterium]|nr:MATE family efflux transporter [Solirubrobacteraceae bacterium]
MRTAQRNISASVITALIGIAAALIATPMIIDYVGKAAYGVWTVSMAIVIYIGIIEAGMAPAVQRYIAVARGADDHAGAARVFWSTLTFYLGIGILAALIIELLAPQIAALFDFPRGLEEQATELLRIVGLAVPLGLAMAALANLLQGQGRFTSIAVTAALGSVGYLTAVIWLVGSGATLAQLGWAVIAQQSVLLVSRAVLAAGSLRVRPGLVSGEEAVAIAGLSARLQLSVASLIINGQSDRVVTALVAPPAVVAEVGIA